MHVQNAKKVNKQAKEALPLITPALCNALCASSSKTPENNEKEGKEKNLEGYNDVMPKKRLLPRNANVKYCGIKRHDEKKKQVAPR